MRRGLRFLGLFCAMYTAPKPAAANKIAGHQEHEHGAGVALPPPPLGAGAGGGAMSPPPAGGGACTTAGGTYIAGGGGGATGAGVDAGAGVRAKCKLTVCTGVATGGFAAVAPGGGPHTSAPHQCGSYERATGAAPPVISGTPIARRV